MTETKWTGSRWWRCDFHNHSPASNDYGKGPDSAKLRSITPRDWLLGYMNAQIDCVAVTDHNSAGWVEELKTALDELRVERPNGFRELTLFPGIELTVQGNIHVLAIFDPSRTKSDLDLLIGAVQYRGTRGGSDDCCDLSLAEVVDQIQRAKGIAIAAHVDQPTGLFVQAQGNTLQHILKNVDFSAIEVVDSSKEKPEIYRQSKKNLTEILSSDSHHPAGEPGQRYPGTVYTWLKMETPNLEGVQLALIDGPLSVRRSDSVAGDQNGHSSLVIECVEVSDAKYFGRSKPVNIPLNPWMNTIIGGRGTGKSSVLEFIRLALDRSSEVPSALRPDMERYSKISASRKDDGLLLEGTSIRVSLLKDGVRFRVAWTQSGRIVERLDGNGNWAAAQGDVPQRFPVRLYSQKQIFEVSKRPQALLQVMDDSETVSGKEWKIQKDRLVAEFMEARARERSIRADVSGQDYLVGELEDVNTKLSLFEQAGGLGVLTDFRKQYSIFGAVNRWEDSWMLEENRIEVLAEGISDPELVFTDEAVVIDEDLAGAVEKVRDAVRNARSKLEEAKQILVEAKRIWQDERSSLNLTKNLHERTAAYMGLAVELSRHGIENPSEYSGLMEKKIEIEKRLKGVEELLADSRKAEKRSEDALGKLKEHRRELTKRRKEFLSKHLQGNSQVQIEIVELGSTESLEEELRGLLGRSGNGFEKDIGTIESMDGAVGRLAKSNGTALERIESLANWLKMIRRGSVVDIAKVKDKRFTLYVQSLPDEQMDRIEAWMPDDLVNVSYKTSTGDMKPVEHASPGQRTAALLSFILSYGNEPLLLDQPEDDLDNKLIYSLIVAQLREMKSRRQVVVVTHNANIVVNGDAENVVVLGVKGGQTLTVQQGGLQKSAVREEVCTIMEGGREAFELRYRRMASS